MKLVISLFLLYWCVQQAAIAQKMSREERRALEAELRQMSREPARYQRWKEEGDRLTEDIRMRTSQQANVNTEYDQIIKVLADKDEEYKRLIRNRDTGKRPLTQPQDDVQALFRVQIGAYRNIRLARNLRPNTNFEVEDVNGVKKYLLGKFTSYNEARVFCEALNRVGAEGYVVGYLNGIRVENLKKMPTEFMK